jgi:hypothetical protein
MGFPQGALSSSFHADACSECSSITDARPQAHIPSLTKIEINNKHNKKKTPKKKEQKNILYCCKARKDYALFQCSETMRGKQQEAMKRNKCH